VAELERLLRALLLAADHPLTVDEVVALVGAAVDDEEWPERVDAAGVVAALKRVQAGFAATGGIELAEMAGGWRLRTAPDLGPMVRRLWPERTPRLSKAALETLAVVAYRQPCTRLDVEDVRGVDCGAILKSLMDRSLVRLVGRKDEPGRPLLYGTTPEFLETFSLDTLRSLPTLRDLESMRAEEAARAKGDREEV
jgi:segregation and condensation protein B